LHQILCCLILSQNSKLISISHQFNTCVDGHLKKLKMRIICYTKIRIDAVRYDDCIFYERLNENLDIQFDMNDIKLKCEPLFTNLTNLKCLFMILFAVNINYANKLNRVFPQIKVIIITMIDLNKFTNKN